MLFFLEPTIKRKISERIVRASITVVYLSKNTARSEWVKWEVEKSLELGKRVIAVHSGDSMMHRQPTWLTDSNVKVVPWTKLSGELK